MLKDLIESRFFKNKHLEITFYSSGELFQITQNISYINCFKKGLLYQHYLKLR